jgi:hypothetical protein
MKRLCIPMVALIVATPASAQMSHGGDASLAPVRGLYETVRGYIVAAAEQMPEEHYGFKPTPEVRSFGQLVGHVANFEHLREHGDLQAHERSGAPLQPGHVADLRPGCPGA